MPDKRKALGDLDVHLLPKNRTSEANGLFLLAKDYVAAAEYLFAGQRNRVLKMSGGSVIEQCLAHAAETAAKAFLIATDDDFQSMRAGHDLIKLHERISGSPEAEEAESFMRAELAGLPSGSLTVEQGTALISGETPSCAVGELDISGEDLFRWYGSHVLHHGSLYRYHQSRVEMDHPKLWLVGESGSPEQVSLRPLAFMFWLSKYICAIEPLIREMNSSRSGPQSS